MLFVLLPAGFWWSQRARRADVRLGTSSIGLTISSASLAPRPASASHWASRGLAPRMTCGSGMAWPRLVEQPNDGSCAGVLHLRVQLRHHGAPSPLTAARSRAFSRPGSDETGVKLVRWRYTIMERMVVNAVDSRGTRCRWPWRYLVFLL